MQRMPSSLYAALVSLLPPLPSWSPAGTANHRGQELQGRMTCRIRAFRVLQHQFHCHQMISLSQIPLTSIVAHLLCHEGSQQVEPPLEATRHRNKNDASPLR